ncbi:MAG: hypothetical protein M0R50_10955 [Candidatus Cloacimonetes bacterium]|nr:hypothetical protein [Candidatus Cloacimonadota bacterium]
MATSNKRIVDSSIPQTGLSPIVIVKVRSPSSPSSVGVDIGASCIKYEFMAMLNGGEQVCAKFHDPHFTIYKYLIGNEYFDYSRSEVMAPVEIQSLIKWNASSTIKTETQQHALVTMAPCGRSNSSDIEFLAVDYPSYVLTGGDAGGGSYKGNVSSVIKQVVEKYGKSRCTVEFDGNTKDSQSNRWWQMRMDPKTFISSILEWSTSVSDDKTRWMLYPDGEKLIIKEQSKVESKQRATYEWRGLGGSSDSRAGDIIDWEFIGDNALQMLQHQLVTSGMSSISGAYFDQSAYKKKKDVIFVGDRQTGNKLKPKVDSANGLSKSYTKPDFNADPTDDACVGWSYVQSIPEFSAGDMGLKYKEYIDGQARGTYLSSSSTLLRMRFRVFGHYIWSGSEGLGADTIYITLSTSAKGAPPYFVAGNWIVYGFHHIYKPGSWVTDLYCYRLDRDATAKNVGKGA